MVWRASFGWPGKVIMDWDMHSDGVLTEGLDSRGGHTTVEVKTISG